MTNFMVDITLPVHFDEEYISLIPAQRRHVNSLMEQATVTGYTLAADRSRLWVTLVADTEREAREVIASFPLFKYFQVRIVPLAFHHMSMMSFIKVSLN